MTGAMVIRAARIVSQVFQSGECFSLSLGDGVHGPFPSPVFCGRRLVPPVMG